jgi:hypothetical protein
LKQELTRLITFKFGLCSALVYKITILKVTQK